MPTRTARHRRRVAAAMPDPGRRRADWGQLFRVGTLDAALQEVALRFAEPEDLELVVESPGDAPREIARYRGPGAASSRTERFAAARVSGRPEWTLLAARGPSPLTGPAELERAADALSAWRAAREELVRADARHRARTRELDLLQTLGRGAAEARTWIALFGHAASVLHEATGADAVLVAHALGGEAEVRAFLGRPLASADLEDLARQAAAAADLADGASPRIVREPLAGFEERHGPRRGTGAVDIATAPVARSGRTVAAVALAPPGPVDERSLRLFYGAVNQVSLHLDRILTFQEAEEDRFRSILDSMPQAVILTDRLLHVVQSNRSAVRLLERLGLGAAGGRLSRIGSLDVEPVASAVLGGGDAPGEKEALLDGGTVLSVTLTPPAGGGGLPEGLVLVLADVTESRRLQAQLAQAEKMSTLGEMISGVAHELNNPLSSVLGYAQLVREAATERRLAARLDVIHREARRCQRIVQNLLAFARRHEPERKLLSLNEVMESVLGFMAYQFRVSDVRVEKELARDVPSILGDAHQLQQAVLNLVSNAHQAIRSAGRGGTISVRTRRSRPGWVLLEVVDDGPGIPEAILPRIFDPFFTTKAAGQGTGLGLSLVEAAVATHGGTVSVDSIEGRGAKFRIELPVGSGAPLVEAGSETEAAAVPWGPPGRILVVDDEESVAQLICDALSEEGHRAEPVRDGREALDRIAREEFDLVVTDLRMPGMGGARLYEEMARLRPGVSKRILLTTGDTVSREPEAFAATRGLDVLAKPFDLEDLRRAVRNRLRSCRGL